MVRYNIYSPEDTDVVDDSGMTDTSFMRNLKKVARKSDLRKASRYASGSFTYSSAGDKNQEYDLDIKNGWDAIIVANMLTNGNINTALPAGFNSLYRLLVSAGYPLSNDFISLFKSEIAPWIKTGRKSNGVTTVINPISGRKIDRSKSTFKKIFKGIKLRHVTYKSLDMYNTIDYKVNEFCVPSYLEHKLRKKVYGKIKDELMEIKTPTYPQLTELLNTINYGLDVYSVDGDMLQKQEYENKIRIMIHDSHMYVLRGDTLHKGTTTKFVPSKEYNELVAKKSTPFYTDIDVIVKGIKYKVADPFKNEGVTFSNFKSTYGDNNIEFYESSNIKPVRYYNSDNKYVSGVDINKCYYNIISNPNYIFAVQNGLETTTEYVKSAKSVNKTSFYYCKFKDPSDIELALWGKEAWILGNVIKTLKLNVQITHVHNVQNMAHGVRNKLNMTNATRYTGCLAKYILTDDVVYNCSDKEESSAIADKYNDDSYYSNGNVVVRKERYAKRSGLYVYMSITQYARMELYQTHMQIKKIHRNANIVKVYTDSIHYDTQISAKDVTKINKAFKYHTVKQETSEYTMDYKYIKPQVNINVVNETNYKKDDIIELLENNKSFCMNAKGGYGKTYEMINTVIPYLDKHGKKYVMSSSTIKSASDIGGTAIQTLLTTKDKSLNNLIKTYEDVDYMVIDECGQLTMHLLNTMCYIKKHTGMNFILMGDMNQCSPIDGCDSWMTSHTFMKLVDGNFVSFEWSEHCRYSKEYDTFLNELLDIINTTADKVKMMGHIKKFFKKQITKSPCKNKLYMVYTHKKGDMVKKQLGIDYMTVHKAQGMTINEPHSIFEIHKMPAKVLYTALTRTTDHKLITIQV